MVYVYRLYTQKKAKSYLIQRWSTLTNKTKLTTKKSIKEIQYRGEIQLQRVPGPLKKCLTKEIL